MRRCRVLDTKEAIHVVPPATAVDPGRAAPPVDFAYPANRTTPPVRNSVT